MQIRPEARSLAPVAVSRPASDAAQAAPARPSRTPARPDEGASSSTLGDPARNTAARVQDFASRVEERLAGLASSLGPRASSAVRAGAAEALRGLERLETGVAAGTIDPRSAGELLDGILGELTASIAPSLGTAEAPADPSARTEQRLAGLFSQLHDRLDGEVRADSAEGRAGHARLATLEQRVLGALEAGTLDRADLDRVLAGLGAGGVDRGEGVPRMDTFLEEATTRLQGLAGSDAEAASAARAFLDLLERMDGALGGSLDGAGAARTLGRALAALRSDLQATVPGAEAPERGARALVDRSA